MHQGQHNTPLASPRSAFLLHGCALVHASAAAVGKYTINTLTVGGTTSARTQRQRPREQVVRQVQYPDVPKRLHEAGAQRPAQLVRAEVQEQQDVAAHVAQAPGQGVAGQPHVRQRRHALPLRQWPAEAAAAGVEAPQRLQGGRAPGRGRDGDARSEAAVLGAPDLGDGALQSREEGDKNQFGLKWLKTVTICN